MENLKEFQEIIGYSFKDEALLRQALTHSSFAHEKRMKELSDNERLEFLGDAVLEVVSSDFLYHEFSNVPEGELTKLRASIVCEPTLAYCAKEINLGKYIYLSHGEDTSGGRERKSILSDAMEAVIGAIYLDGGIEFAKKHILKYVLNDLEHKQLFHDSKSKLQELIQGKYKSACMYRVISEDGPDHAKHFVVEAYTDDFVLGRGEGNSKKAAEQDAAYHALLTLKNQESN